MSRTIRRKNSYCENDHVGWDFIRMHAFYVWRAGIIPKYSKKWYQQYWNYHKDNHPGQWTAPKFYHKFWHKTWKMEDKQEITRFIKEPEQYEPLFNPRKNNADWDWGWF